MRSVVLSMIYLMLSVLPCHALSNAEYEKLIIESHEFRDADKKLSALWKQIRGKLDDDSKTYFINMQRKWVRSGRDESAREFMNVGLSKNAAYTRATIRRIHELQAVWHNLNLTKDEQENGLAKDDEFFCTEEDYPEYYINR